MDRQISFNLTLVDKRGGIRSPLQAIFGHQIDRFVAPKDHIEFIKFEHDSPTLQHIKLVFITTTPVHFE